MPNSNMKNIVVLKNLPSNLIDEAIVIIKSNKNAKKLQLAEKNTSVQYKEPSNNKDYVIREAESVISNYIAKIERNKTIKKSNNNIEIKYKKMKIYSVIVSIILGFCLIKTIF